MRDVGRGLVCLVVLLLLATIIGMIATLNEVVWAGLLVAGIVFAFLLARWFYLEP